MPKLTRIARTDQIPEGNVLKVSVSDIDLTLVNTGGSICLFQGNCPHQGTSLSMASLSNGILTCAAHGWGFHCPSGVHVENPNVGLQTFAVTISDGYVLVDENQISAWKAKQSSPSGPTKELRSKTISTLPGPKTLPWIGNFHQWSSKRPHSLLDEWCDQYGPIYTFRLFEKTFVVVGRADLITQVLRDRPGIFRRMGTVETVFAELGTHGLFSAEGDNWRRHRLLTMPAFNSSHLQDFFGTLRTVTHRLCKRWGERAGQSADVEVQKDLVRFTVDVTTNLAFGYDMNTTEKGEDVIQQHLDEIFPVMGRRIVAPFPYWRYFKLPRDRKIDRALLEIRKSVDSFVLSAREKMRLDPQLHHRPSNFLEGLLAQTENETSPLTDDELVGNILTILLAGEDTTANSLAWMMHFIAEYPEVQKKMQAEADNILGEAKAPETYQDIERLSYTEAVAMEALRLRPVAPFLILEATQATKIDGVSIPKGTQVAVLTGYCGVQDVNFGSGKQFIPERWLPSRASSIVHNPKAFLAFGEGPRFCPGRNLAITEMKTIGAMLSRNFNLTKPSNGKVPRQVYHFVVKPEDLWLHIDRR